MRNERNYIVFFAAILSGIVLSYAYVAPYSGCITLLSGSSGELALGFNSVEIVGFAMRLTPIWILEMFLGIELYQHFCTASVFVFSRCTDRSQWYWRETLNVALKVFLFHVIFLGFVIATAMMRYEVEIDAAGVIPCGYHLLIYLLWSLAMTVLVNILALKFGSSISFMVVMMIQAVGIALFCLGGMFEDRTPQQEVVLIWNPMAHLVLGWQRSIFPQVMGQPLYENFYLEVTLLFLWVLNVVVLILGAVMIKKQDLLVSDCEIGVI